jgi:hypothetical protein
MHFEDNSDSLGNLMVEASFIEVAVSGAQAGEVVIDFAGCYANPCDDHSDCRAGIYIPPLRNRSGLVERLVSAGVFGSTSFDECGQDSPSPKSMGRFRNPDVLGQAAGFASCSELFQPLPLP